MSGGGGLAARVAVVLLVATVVACTTDGASRTTAEASGVVLSVNGSSPTDVSSFTLRTDAGEVLSFEIGELEVDADAFPAAHLREHIASGEPVRVRYREAGERLLAVRLEDAPRTGGSPASGTAAESEPPSASPAGSQQPSEATASSAPRGTPRTSRSPEPSAEPTAEETPGATVAAPNEIADGLAIEPVEFATGFERPLFLTHAGDGSGRVYVVEQGGRVEVVEADGGLSSGTFLDVSDRISAGGERGLLGLAFHPEFDDNGRLFVNYTGEAGDTVIAEYSADAETADPESERVVLTVDQPYPNHNGGWIGFGPDGFLYIALGDGGSGGDPHGNGQRTDTLLGKMLRIDVDSGADDPYAIPDDNPFADDASSAGEIWHYGLRNPFRASFDRATGDLWIGDVGQGSREEVSFARAGESGLNFGWNLMEGHQCFAQPDCQADELTLPIVSYPRDLGSVVTGGYVYRGSADTDLAGIYVFGDFASGAIFGVPTGGPVDTPITEPQLLAQTDLAISSFGEDESGELYLTDFSNGAVYRVTATR